MNTTNATKKSYVTPDMSVLVIRSEERFTMSSGGCDIGLTKGTPDIEVEDLRTDTLILNSGFGPYARTNSIPLS